MNQAPKRNRRRLDQGSLLGHLMAMTGPMTLGILAVVGFNLVDTLFIARLGTQALAAVSLTFPVTAFFGSLSLGLGAGAGSVLARALGRQDSHQVKKLATHSLLFAFIIVCVFLSVGLTTIEPVFKLLGATPDLQGNISAYMVIWYLGMPFMVVPMVGNSLIRATGNAWFPALLMVGSGILNIFLDWVLIFGMGPIPPLGVAGAALATAIAKSMTFFGALWVLVFRMGLVLNWREWGTDFLGSVRRIAHIAFPAAATQVLLPLFGAGMTALIARFGTDAVAAWGICTRVESFTLIPVLALGSAIGPIVGQNWGASEWDRVERCIGLGLFLATGWCVLSAVALFLTSGFVGRSFSSEQLVLEEVALFMNWVPWSWIGIAVSVVAASSFNAIGQPMQATQIVIARAFLVGLPLAVMLGYFFGYPGVVQALALSNIIGGGLALYYLKVRIHTQAIR